MDYFAGIKDADMKAEYRRLASKLHPDKGGSTAAFQEMKRQYEYWEKTGKRFVEEKPRAQTKPSGGNYNRGYQQSEYSDYRSEAKKNAHQSFEIWRDRNGVAYRILQTGNVKITPYHVNKNKSDEYTSHGYDFAFDVNDLKQGQRTVIKDTDNRVAIRIIPKFVASNLKASIEVSDLDLLHKNKILMNVYSEGILFGTIQITDHIDYYRFFTGKDVSLTAKYKPDSIKDIRVRPDIDWTFNGMIEATVKIKSTKAPMHIAQMKETRKMSFIEKFKIAWKFLTT